MIPRSVMSAVLVASATGLFVSTPAMAQTRQDDARFEAAQQRLDSELAIFKAEFDRYQRARSGEPQGSPDDRRYDDPRGNGEDPRIGDDQPRPSDEDRQRNPENLDQPGYQPPR